MCVCASMHYLIVGDGGSLGSSVNDTLSNIDHLGLLTQESSGSRRTSISLHKISYGEEKEGDPPMVSETLTLVTESH